MSDNFIQWMGDNQYEVNQFCGQRLEEAEHPDMLIVPTINGNVDVDLGDYIVKTSEGLSVISEKDFRPINN